MSRLALITGGTGFVGSHTVETYLAAGWRVRALIRNPQRLTWLKDLPVELAVGSFSDPDSIRAAVRDADAVVHCAAVTKSARRAEYYEVNATAVETLAVAARDAGVKRFVLCSTHAASGPAQDGLASREDDPPRPLTDYGKSKLEGENRLRQVAGTMEWVILRPPSVLGPRDEQFVPLFRSVARYGMYPVLGSGQQSYSYIYVKDIARALLTAGEATRGLGETYFAAHEEPLDWSRAAAIIGQLSGKQARQIRVPALAAKAVGRVNDVIQAVSGHAALLSSDKIREMLAAGWVCSTEKIRRTWDFSCQYSTEQALRETFEFYRRTKRL